MYFNPKIVTKLSEMLDGSGIFKKLIPDLRSNLVNVYTENQCCGSGIRCLLTPGSEIRDR